RLASIDGITRGPHVTHMLRFGGKTVKLPRRVQAFFQGHRYLLEDLVAHVVNHVPTGGALADLYAGVGLFAVAAAATRGASLVAVEGDPFAADDLRANAAAAGGQIVAKKGAVEEVLSGAVSAPGMPDAE